jgi:hypothetical protein
MTRAAEGWSTTYVRRDDGVTLELPSYAPLRRLPHDLAHFVVEHALGLTRGFWGSIAEGAVFGGVEVLPRKRTARVEERSRQVMKDASSRVTEAEAIVGTVVEIYQRRLDRDWAAARALLRGTWRPARPSRELPTQAEVHRACQELSDAENRWLGMAIGSSVTLVWPRQAAAFRRDKARSRQRRRTSAFSRRANARG